ncbi:transcription elongation factor spt5-like [Juglans microcarpa x Juglans regia]|uniref:transcription elongation factor spt5-like n=1 Tax=Juglans microcarpa x Juglans regia TaxID=2249226 RepID=UPI001B7DC2AB|nr:transcription elongation factor spt5-like [Juglans microcarpa x Juglans regia]
MKIASLPVLLLCLLFLLILLIFLSLSLSVSKQHNMFLSTYEFIVVKKSIRVVVFFMFNVIIITIFRGNLKPSAEDTDNWLLSFSHLLVYEADEATKDQTTWEEEYYDEDSDVDHEYNHGYDGYEEDNDDDDDDGGEDGFESKDDQQDKDDLERRIKEFIAKNYRQRREELMYEAGLHGSYRVQKYPALANY